MGRGVLFRRRVNHTLLVAQSMIGKYFVLGESRVSNIQVYTCLGVFEFTNTYLTMYLEILLIVKGLLGRWPEPDFIILTDVTME